MNSLPKTVTRQRHGCDSNPGPFAPKSPARQPLGYRATRIRWGGPDLFAGRGALARGRDAALYAWFLFQLRIKNWQKHFDRQWQKQRGRRRAQQCHHNHAALPSAEALDSRERVARLDVLPVYTRNRPLDAPAYDAVGQQVSRALPVTTAGPAGPAIRSNNCVSRVDVRNRR